MPPSPLFPVSPASSAPKDRDKGVNVQVLVRCRPFNEDELRLNGPQVIVCNEDRREVTVATKLIDRSFTFDKVFGQQAQQKDLYDQAISPIVNEVLEGFSCTIFAYGQTGTGKTYTMEGAAKKTSKSQPPGELPPEAGVIPRAVEQIFHALDMQQAEYSMKVTFLELYNEEIMDLLAPDDLSKSIDDRQRKPLALMEDGKGGILVRGLEEETVYSANDIFNLLERGSAKRRTAETLLNKQSSRSHSIFSIIIHIKESSLGGEELIKCGRLNLVDLAGSENISRSGAREGRAREAGEINKSLLTLGRVITSLVEHLGHVPYRDSKLTRLLRESLGGKTKTCIIATISPCFQSLEETLSTLDYAYRAKSIKNKPEMNQKVLKSAFIKDLYMEIEKLKREVLAAREKNGIYLPRDRYLQEEAEKKAMSDKIEQMEAEIQANYKQLEEMQTSLHSQEQFCALLSSKLEVTQKRLEETENDLMCAEGNIKEAQYTIKEREYVISKLQESENGLVQKAVSLRSDLESSVNDITQLQHKIERKDIVETQNLKVVQGFHSSLGEQLEALRNTVAICITNQQQQLQNMEEQLKLFVASKEEAAEKMKEKASNLKDLYCFGLKGLLDMVQLHDQETSATVEKLNTAAFGHSSVLVEFFSAAVSEAESLTEDLQAALYSQESEVVTFTRQLEQEALRNIESLRTISQTTIDFFANLERSISELRHSFHRSNQTQREWLDKLELTYEDSSKREEEQLIQKIAEMLSAATARKSELVRSEIKYLRDVGIKDYNEMECEMQNINALTSKTRVRWQGYVSEAETSYTEHSAELSKKTSEFGALIQEIVKATKTAGNKWKAAQESMQNLEKDNLSEVESIVKEGVSNNAAMLIKFRESNESIASSIEDGYAQALESVEGSLKNDRDGVGSALTCCSSQSDSLEILQASHNHGTMEIEGLAKKSFNEEYQEDKPAHATPSVKRLIEVPTRATIEALRAPDFEKMLQEFRDANSVLLVEKAMGHRYTSGETKIPIFPDSSLARDGRVPLVTLN